MPQGLLKGPRCSRHVDTQDQRVHRMQACHEHPRVPVLEAGDDEEPTVPIRLDEPPHVAEAGHAEGHGAGDLRERGQADAGKADRLRDGGGGGAVRDRAEALRRGGRPRPRQGREPRHRGVRGGGDRPVHTQGGLLPRPHTPKRGGAYAALSPSISRTSCCR